MKKNINFVFEKTNQEGFIFKKKANNFKDYKLLLVPFFCFIAISIATIRIFQLTTVKGSLYKFIAEKNRFKEVYLEPLRGKIFDRKGNLLAYSTNNKEEVNRMYNESEATAHFIGYRQIADTLDIKNDICPNKVGLNDKVGKEGFEKIYECQLRGEKGKKVYEVNAKGQIIKANSLKNPIPGQDLTSSIDLELQKIAYEEMKNKNGAIIATKPQTGEILVFVSSPSFDLMNFEKNNQEMIKKYIDDTTKPLFNRLTKGLYPPGSVFKPTIATGGLEDKVIDENFEIEDTGKIKAGPIEFGNWYFLQYGKTEGNVNVVKSLKRSNDIFYYKLGEKMGEEKMKKWAEKFGYGEKINFPFAQENGSIPSPFWKEEKLHEKWFLGDSYNLSIGQGYLTVNPMQVNMATIPFANNGSVCDPQILKTTPDKAKCKNLNISNKTLNIVREGMKEACSTGGTAWPFFDFKIPTGCKTGTAESYSQKHMPHAWFTIFAPFEKAEIVVTVLVEESGEGSDIAAPIAKKILSKYFSL